MFSVTRGSLTVGWMVELRRRPAHTSDQSKLKEGTSRWHLPNWNPSESHSINSATLWPITLVSGTGTAANWLTVKLSFRVRVVPGNRTHPRTNPSTVSHICSTFCAFRWVESELSALVLIFNYVTLTTGFFPLTSGY